eukprot:gene10036-13493_t
MSNTENNLKTKEEKNSLPKFSFPSTPAFDTPSGSALSRGPEYIPYNNRGRDIYGRMSFNTGVFWFSGFLIGGSYGVVEGWRNAVSPNYKIRFNSIMNGFSKRGNSLANSLGIIAFLHTGSVWIADTLEFEKHSGTTVSTPIFSGAVTGGMFSIPRGYRAAALASVIGSGVSCAYWYGSSYVYNVMLGKSGRY